MKHPGINLQNSFHNNIKEILLHYTYASISFLDRDRIYHENIHQARLCFKRIRSFIRLTQKAFPGNTYYELNTFYRDQARVLSSIRDITAIIGISREMMKTRRSDSVKSFLKSYVNALQKQRIHITHNPDLQNSKHEVIESLTIKAEEIKGLDLIGEPVDCLASGIKKIYKKGYHFLHLATENPDDHLLHEWRKQVKYLWYHFVFLNAFWPGIMNAFAKQNQQLSQLLGKQHDYVILEHSLMQNRFADKKQNTPRELKRSIKRAKERLTQSSLTFGKKVFVLSPVDFEDFMKRIFILEIQKQ